MLRWSDHRVELYLTAIRETSDGVHAEMAVQLQSEELSWGRLNLVSTSVREQLVKKLAGIAPDVPWRPILERVCRLTVKAIRTSEPLVTLTGKVMSPTRELLPRLLYEGEPTLLYADGDTGKSLVALTVAVAMHSGSKLPWGLKPARAVSAAFLDWETSRDTVENRLALLAAGLGIDPPGILYKRMTRPLVDEAKALAAEFSRRGVGFVVIDSKMFAVAGGDGAAFHEPVTAFYNALRLFAPAASLVLNHVTNADARANAPARPDQPGAIEGEGPAEWEAKRDGEIDDATAIVFTCTKANNLPRKPDPFGLKFQPGEGTITVYPFDIAEAASLTPSLALGMVYRLKLALAHPKTVDALAEELKVNADTIRRTLNRGRTKGTFVPVPGTKPRRGRSGAAGEREAGQPVGHSRDTVDQDLFPPTFPAAYVAGHLSRDSGTHLSSPSRGLLSEPQERDTGTDSHASTGVPVSR